MFYKILKISISLILLLLIFLIGVYVGHYKTFPYDIIKETKFKITNSVVYSIYDTATIDFFFNKMTKCVEENDNSFSESNNYRFFIAGHTYGKPNGNNIGLYPKFINQLKLENNFTFGILAGDIVRESNKKSWDKIDLELSKFNYPFYFAPGNHDVGYGINNNKRKIFISRYGKTYYSLKQK